MNRTNATIIPLRTSAIQLIRNETERETGENSEAYLQRRGEESKSLEEVEHAPQHVRIMPVVQQQRWP